jgi:hypothetical protein
MSERLSRNALYDLVWSEPLKNLSARFGISDVALKKTCARAQIPTPERGYWAKKDAGKETFQAEVPLRPPGMSDEVEIGAGGTSSYHYWTEEEILGPIGPPPEFPESIEVVRARIAETIGHVTVPRNVLTWHPTIDRLLKDDEQRRQKQLNSTYTFSWEKPRFESPLDRRRLRILNSLFFAVGKMNGKPHVSGREELDIGISFFQQHLHISLDRVRGPNRRTKLLDSSEPSNHDRLCLSILKGYRSEASEATWQDDDAQKLEAKITDIAVHLIFTAETDYRADTKRRFEWRVQRKAELEEEQRKRKLEAERAERERQKRIEQGRVNRLLKDAAAFQQAGEIRRYVATIRDTQARDVWSGEEFQKWSQWALAVADRIDPTVNKSFLKAMHDEDES